jgi:hypothetical protein
MDAHRGRGRARGEFAAYPRGTWTRLLGQRERRRSPGYRMRALDVRAGAPIPSFGRNGAVDLKLEDDHDVSELGLNATPRSSATSSSSSVLRTGRCIAAHHAQREGLRARLRTGIRRGDPG